MMKVNLKKTVMVCNGSKAKKLIQKVWKTGGLPPLKVILLEILEWTLSGPPGDALCKGIGS
eukprot:1338164-Amphidinium_carterae.3